MPCSQITCLSDDSDHDESQPVLPAESPPETAQPSKRRSLTSPRAPSLAEIRGKLGKLTNSLCGCARSAKRTSARSCFKQFHGGGVEALFQLVWQLKKLDKFDMDCKAGFEVSSNVNVCQIFALV